MINTIEDLINHFHADFYPDDLDRSLRSLDRRIYKDTNCGAWAKVESPGERVDGKRKEMWTCAYHKLDGVWTRGIFADSTGTLHEDSAVPRAVRDYFWPDFDDLQQTLESLSSGRSSFLAHEEVDVPIMVAHQGMFLVGSIVEGTDAEITAQPVYLPCPADALDTAVAYVEDEANLIWNETHGCEGCNDGDVGGSIDPECKRCGGNGVVL